MPFPPRPSRLIQPTPLFWGIAGAVSCLAWAALAWTSHQSLPAPSALASLLASLGVAWLALGWACRVAPGSPHDEARLRRLLWAFGLLFRTFGLLSLPVLEDDFHRYLWDGRMFAETGNPYGVAPLDKFSDPGIEAPFQTILSQINHPELPTVYGPVCQFVFLLGYLVAPGKLLALKFVLVAADLGSIFIVRRQLTWRALALWLWCPLLVHETSIAAHPDTLGVLATIAALRALAAGQATRTGLLLALAVGTRPFAVLLLPFLLWRGCGGFRLRLVLAFALTVAMLHVPFWLARHGAGVGLQAFAEHWEFNSAGFAVLQACLGTDKAKVAGALLLLAGGAWMLHGARIQATPSTGSALPSCTAWPHGDRIFGLLFLVSPVVNPWYLQWMVPFAAVRPAPWNMALLAAVSLSYATGANLGSDQVPGFNHPVWLRPLEFGLVGMAALAFGWLRRRPRPEDA